MIRYGLILGIEGVLCSTAHLHLQAWAKVLTEMGASCDCLQTLDVTQLSREECLKQILYANQIELSQAEREVLLQEKNEQYRQLLSTLNEEDILPGVMTLLTHLRSRGIMLCVVATSCNAQLILRSLGLGTFFDVVCDGNDLAVGMAHDMVYRQACDRMAVQRTYTIVWDNMPSKRADAQRAGLAVFGGDVQEAVIQTEKWLSAMIPA